MYHSSKIVCSSPRGWDEAGKRLGNLGELIIAQTTGSAVLPSGDLHTKKCLSILNIKFQLQFKFKKAERIK